MDFSASLLHAKIAAVCPIVSVAIGDPNNAKTWRIDFNPAATPPQIAAAQAQLAAITPAALASAAGIVQAVVISDPLAAAKAQALAALPSAVGATAVKKA